MCRLIAALLAILVLPGITFAETYVVRPDGTGDFATIQAAVDGITEGDVIELTDGTFTGHGNRNIHGNISDDPLFCDVPGGDLRLNEGSPCAPFTPPNEECDLIGAWPVGCESTATEWTTWGQIRTQFGR